LSRKKLSAIVITASGLALKPFGGVLAYSCTKTFVNFLGQGLSYELEGKVDCLSWMCEQVHTNLNRAPLGGTVITPKAAV